MKITSVVGSPRKDGNSVYMNNLFLNIAREQHHEIEEYFLQGMNYSGCRACYGCKIGSERCVIKDDLFHVLESVKNSDMLIMASPVYFGDVSSQLKGFIDRTFSFLNDDFKTSDKPSRLESGKKAVFLLAQGHLDVNKFSDIYPKYSHFFKMMGFTNTYEVRAVGVTEELHVNMNDQIISNVINCAKQTLS
jgi:multimeric flavodoxin WrbA